jgi:hypothetical protein
MKLTLRPEWRLWPLVSFLGLLDLKTGVTVALLFALLNKVAGVYGLIAVLTGAGGSFAQLSLYMYSVLALVALAWGLRAVKAEDPKHTFYFAHLFFADHILSTIWTVFFAVVWWVYTPHDGQRTVNSAAQEEMAKGGKGGSKNMTDKERIAAANMIWNKEKGTAAAIIVLSWLAKIYFALLIYSYATHLRKGSYRSLPHSRSTGGASSAVPSAYEASAIPDEDEEIEDFYRVPLRTPQTGGSINNFSDFVAAPGTPRRGKGGKSSLSQVSNSPNGHAGDEEIEDVLFDDDIGTSVSAGSDFNLKEEEAEERGLASQSQSHSRS